MIAQVLVKSCKMIPVMVMGTLIGGVYYSSLEYVCALLLAAGVSLFAFQSSGKVAQKLASPNAPLGYFLCSVNLIFDGYTNATQVICHPASWAACFACCVSGCIASSMMVIGAAGSPLKLDFKSGDMYYISHAAQ